MDSTVVDGAELLGTRPLVVAFEGWNDAGNAASTTVGLLRESLEMYPLAEVDPDTYFDYQLNRPLAVFDDDGTRRIEWPSVTLYGSTSAARASVRPDRSQERELYVLQGAEPSRSWQAFADETIDTLLAHDITSVVLVGALLADVPHTRPISVFTTSDDAGLRAGLGLERSSYEGPTGILMILAEAAQEAGIPTASVWASVPHYVHNAPSPKAALALVERVEDLLGAPIPRGDLENEAQAWEEGLDALAAEDDDMAGYIQQLEQARDTVDSPDASGEAIAREFEQYLRRRGDDGRSGPPGRR